MTESAYWESHYQKGETPWDKGEASPGLLDFFENQPDLMKGSVCIPGCGMGHDVRAWAKHGFQATGMDIAPSAVRGANQIVTEHELSCKILEQDFLSPKRKLRFQWVFEHTFYCAIHPSQRHDYLKALTEWLEPEGQFLAVHYLIDDVDGPPFGTTRQEVLERFGSHFSLIDDWTPRSYPNRTNLEHMFWWRKKH